MPLGTGRGILLPLIIGISTEGSLRRADTIPDDVARKQRLDYLYSQKDQNQKVLDGVQVLLEHFQKHDFSVDAFMNDALNLMRRRLRVREVTMALLDKKEGVYRYRFQSGLRKDAWDAHAPISYKYGDLVNPAVYKGREVSRATTLFLAEDNPYGQGEDATFSRPVMLRSKRQSVDDSIEGDYYDTWVFGKGREILGWIEYSGTTSGKLLDAASLKWIELIASLASLAITLSEARTLDPRGA